VTNVLQFIQDSVTSVQDIPESHFGEGNFKEFRVFRSVLALQFVNCSLCDSRYLSELVLFTVRDLFQYSPP